MVISVFSFQFFLRWKRYFLRCSVLVLSFFPSNSQNWIREKWSSIDFSFRMNILIVSRDCCLRLSFGITQTLQSLQHRQLICVWRFFSLSFFACVFFSLSLPFCQVFHFFWLFIRSDSVASELCMVCSLLVMLVFVILDKLKVGSMIFNNFLAVSVSV